METSCWFCKKWEEHYYWDHLKLTNHRFKKVMRKDFSEGMAIPNQFVENFKGELSETINLEVITGQVKRVNIEKRNATFSLGQVSQSSMLASHCFKQETSVLHEAKKLKSNKTSIELQLTNAIQPERPYFVKLMTKSAVNPSFFMVIPYKFISKYFKHKPEKVTLQNAQGKKWSVICKYCCGFSRGFGGETWKKFVHENYLKEGDACAFELITFTTKNLTMKVHIVHATEANLP